MARYMQRPGAMDGPHNRKPQKTTMYTLGHRRARRRERITLHRLRALIAGNWRSLA